MKEYVDNLTYGASSEIFKRAKDLKREMTPAEKVPWRELRNGKLDGYKFRRQHPLGKFIADFYCHEKRLVVEVDGEIHDDKDVRERDESRTNELKSFELTLVRFRNEEIFTNLGEVLNKIKCSLGTKSLSEREGKNPSP